MSFAALILILLCAAPVVHGQERRCYDAGSNSLQVKYCCADLGGPPKLFGCSYKNDTTVFANNDDCNEACGSLLDQIDYSSNVGVLNPVSPVDETESQALECVAGVIGEKYDSQSKPQQTKEALLALADGNREQALANLTEAVSGMFHRKLRRWGWKGRGWRGRQSSLCDLVDDSCGDILENAFLFAAEELYHIATTGYAMSNLDLANVQISLVDEVATADQAQEQALVKDTAKARYRAQCTAHWRLRTAMRCTDSASQM